MMYTMYNVHVGKEINSFYFNYTLVTNCLYIVHYFVHLYIVYMKCMDRYTTVEQHIPTFKVVKH